MSKFTRDYVEKNPFVAADRIEELETELRNMVRVYWGKEGDGGEEPDCIKSAKRLLEANPQ